MHRFSCLKSEFSCIARIPTSNDNIVVGNSQLRVAISPLTFTSCNVGNVMLHLIQFKFENYVLYVNRFSTYCISMHFIFSLNFIRKGTFYVSLPRTGFWPTFSSYVFFGLT